VHLPGSASTVVGIVLALAGAKPQPLGQRRALPLQFGMGVEAGVAGLPLLQNSSMQCGWRYNSYSRQGCYGAAGSYPGRRSPRQVPRGHPRMAFCRSCSGHNAEPRHPSPRRQGTTGFCAPWGVRSAAYAQHPTTADLTISQGSKRRTSLLKGELGHWRRPNFLLLE